jgi:hypothetical protein
MRCGSRATGNATLAVLLDHTGDANMTFDALTITGIVWCALSGGFVVATAFAQAPRPLASRRPSARQLASGLAKRVAPAIGAGWSGHFGAPKAATIRA